MDGSVKNADGVMLADRLAAPPTDLDNMRRNSEDYGWSISYHQMGEGCLELGSTTWDCGEISLMSESSNLCLQMIGVPPPGMVSVLIPRKSHGIWFNGCSMGDQSMAVLFPRDKLRFVTPGGTQVISMHVPLSLLEDKLAMLATSTADFVSTSVACIIEDGLAVGELSAFMDSSRFSDSCPDKRLTNEAELVEKLALLLSSHDQKKVVGRDSIAVSRLLSKVDAFLTSYANEPVKLAQLVQFVGVSERSLERLCRSVYDITPCEYIAAFRLNAVREDFLKPVLQDKTISEIALDNGFRHLGRFSAEFRNYFGRSPRQYRREETQSIVA